MQGKKLTFKLIRIEKEFNVATYHILFKDDTQEIIHVNINRSKTGFLDYMLGFQTSFGLDTEGFVHLQIIIRKIEMDFLNKLHES